MRQYLENLRKKYETQEFIKDDPVQFVHRYKKNNQDAELAGFIASIFSYGKRDVFIKKLNLLFNLANDNLMEFVLNFDKYQKKLDGFCYRFYTDNDIKMLFFILQKLYKSKRTIKDLFYKKNTVWDFFNENACNYSTHGFNFMIPNPKLNGANKRMNMFLRWMVRCGPVDIGIWDFIDKKDLIIPLDVHVGNISRELGLLYRKQNDYKSAWLLTQKLKEFRPDDPVGLDFGLFGAGIYKQNSLCFNINEGRIL